MELRMIFIEFILFNNEMAPSEIDFYRGLNPTTVVSKIV